MINIFFCISYNFYTFYKNKILSNLNYQMTCIKSDPHLNFIQTQLTCKCALIFVYCCFNQLMSEHLVQCFRVHEHFYWRLSECIAIDVLQHSACIYIHFTTFNWSLIFILYVLLTKSNIKWVFWYIFYIPKHKLYIFVSVMNLNLFEKLCFYPVTLYILWPSSSIHVGQRTK